MRTAWIGIWFGTVGWRRALIPLPNFPRRKNTMAAQATPAVSPSGQISEGYRRRRGLWAASTSDTTGASRDQRDLNLGFEETFDPFFVVSQSVVVSRRFAALLRMAVSSSFARIK